MTQPVKTIIREVDSFTVHMEPRSEVVTIECFSGNDILHVLRIDARAGFRFIHDDNKLLDDGSDLLEFDTRER